MVKSTEIRVAGRRRRRAARTKVNKDNTYSNDIYKLLKCVNPDASIGATAMNVMNSFVKDILQRISMEASELAHHTNKRTIRSNDVISATKLVVKTSELCENAIAMAERVVKYVDKPRQRD